MADNNRLYLPTENRNRVYINPNFNINTQVRSTNVNMHLNPRFQHLMAPQHQQILNLPNANKIYVNPNFMRSEFNHTINFNANVITQACPVAESIKVTVKSPTILMKSKYCLVRNNVKKPIENNCQKMHTNTIKISKYKLVPLNSVKKEIAINNIKSKIPECSVVPVKPQKQYSRTKINVRAKEFLMTIDKKRLNVKLNKNMKNKIEKNKLKKNNIPCPLFKKFGKCMRASKGYCVFLHDKKHVNICSRFLKGSCHDENCLLSHDLTSKKMPTCFFYLNGVCAKENCPYLHVKMNENTKICPDFLKGYCEKGKDCVYRHVKLKKGNSSKKLKAFLPRNPISIKEIKEKTPTSEDKPEQNKIKEEIDYRYYNDVKSDSKLETEMIKPSRCKLGELPTFIQI